MPPRFLQPPGAPLATLGGIVGLLLAGFLWDLTTPRGYIPWLLYLPALLLTLALPHRWNAPALAGLCTLLILLGHITSPLKGAGNPQAAIFNRTLGIGGALAHGGCLPALQTGRGQAAEERGAVSRDFRAGRRRGGAD